MKFEQPVKVTMKESYDLWRCIEDSYSVERMYEENPNVLITLSDRSSTCRMIYFEAKEGRGIRILDEEGKYVAVAWLQSKKIGGMAEGEKGKRKFIQCLQMFQESLKHGIIELTVEKSPYPPSLHIPVTEAETLMLKLITKGNCPDDIISSLSISRKGYRRMIKSLSLKGQITEEQMMGYMIFN